MMLKRQWEESKLLLRSVPSAAVTIFIVCVIVMNLLANKELFSARYFACDCGIVVSWVSFLCMDMICKRFGGKAAVTVSLLAVVVNVAVCLIFKLMSMTPGMWGEYYTYGMTEVNNALNATFGGTWYVVLGSNIAMVVSAIVNAILNQTIGNRMKNDNFGSFAARSYISTGIGQFVDNLVFALIVSHVFFGWTWIQVFLCSLTGAAVELLFEVLLSPVGYRVVKKWEQDNVGAEYLKMIQE